MSAAVRWREGRREDVATAVAMLADDILHFQQPGGAKKVRLAWARQYYSLPAESPLTADDAARALAP